MKKRLLGVVRDLLIMNMPIRLAQVNNKMNNNKILELQNRWFPIYIGSIVAVIYAIKKGDSVMNTFLIGVIIIIVGAIIFWTRKCLWEKYYRDAHAFTFEMENQSQGQKMLKLPIGKASFLLWAKYYNNDKLEGFAIRFIPTKKIKQKTKQVSASIISIKKADLKWDTSDEIFQKERTYIFEEKISIGPYKPNEPSKWVCKFDRAILRGPKLPIGIKIMVKANEPWKGYFSIESRPQRQYGRIKVEFGNK